MNRQKKFIVDVLFVLALFGVFTISALILVTIGASVYKSTVNAIHSNYEVRTSTSYITEKIRQNNLSATDGSRICVVELAGEEALCLPKQINGTTYYTYLYCHDGYLKELFTSDSSTLGNNVLSAGQNIMEASSLSIEEPEPGLLSVELTFEDTTPERIIVNTYMN
jgi:hypothetical protein